MPKSRAVFSEVMIAMAERRLLGVAERKERSREIRKVTPLSLNLVKRLAHSLNKDLQTQMSLEARVEIRWQAYCKATGSSGDCGVLRNTCLRAKGQLLLNFRQLLLLGM